MLPEGDTEAETKESLSGVKRGIDNVDGAAIEKKIKTEAVVASYPDNISDASTLGNPLGQMIILV